MRRLDYDDLIADGARISTHEPSAVVENYPNASLNKRLKTPAKTSLTVVGLFAGVGGLEEGFRQAGHRSMMLCESDPAARCVLTKHFPDTAITTDVTALTELPRCDVLTAGFPCQDLSQVGRRRGITGPNSGLIGAMFELLRKIKTPPNWIVLENVPFMLSLDRGKAIRAVTAALEGLSYAWAYRVIDSRAFGLPQRRRRVILVASRDSDPRPALLGIEAEVPEVGPRRSHACGFYWTEGNTGLGWAVDSVPPLKGGSALHIPSPPAIWFPRRRLIATPAIEDAERLQGFAAGWTDTGDEEPRRSGKRWRMVGNAVSVPMAKWIGQRLVAKLPAFECKNAVALPSDASWPRAGWGMNGIRARSDVSEWPVAIEAPHLAAFLEHAVTPLSKKATSGFLGRLIKSSLRYEDAFRHDLAHHVEEVDRL